MKRVLILFICAALLGSLCVPTIMVTAEPTQSDKAAVETGVHRIPVAAEVPSDWPTAYLYAWGGSETMTWPGVPMTLIDGWFIAYMNSDHAYVIINDGNGAQTVDLTIDPGMPVCIMAGDHTNARVEPELPIEVPAEADMPKPATNKVYAYVPESWDAANLYAWTADASSSNAGWPGVPMTQGDNGLWVGELTPGYANIIVNDGGAQTVDLPYNGGDAWVLLTAEGTEGGKFKASVLYEDPGSYAHPAPNKVVLSAGPVTNSDVWYVAGTMNEWNCSDAGYQMTDNGDGTYTYTFAATPGDYALKVTNGTWDVSYGGNGADGNYEFNVADECNVVVKFDGSTVSHDFASADEVIDNSGDNGNIPGSSDNKDDTDGGNSGLIISIVVTAVILIGGGVAVFFVLKKKN